MDTARSTAAVARVAGVMVPAGVAATLLAICTGLLLPEGAARRFVVFYVAPTLGVAALWLRDRIAAIARDRRAVVMLDTLVFTAALLRFAGDFLPFSGHMLFFTYSLAATRSMLYRICALAILVETTWFKLMVWNDLRSWLLGIAGAGLMILVRIALTGARRAGQ